MKNKCWEIMPCDNLKCPARQEPETPCWQIAARKETYHNVSNTCRDCIVYIHKTQSFRLSDRKLQDIIEQRVQQNNLAFNHQICLS